MAAAIDPSAALIQPLDDYGQKVRQARRCGAVYPYELIAGPGGFFTEYDLDDSGWCAYRDGLGHRDQRRGGRDQRRAQPYWNAEATMLLVALAMPRDDRIARLLVGQSVGGTTLAQIITTVAGHK